MASVERDQMIAALAVAGLDITGSTGQLRKRLLSHMMVNAPPAPTTPCNRTSPPIIPYIQLRVCIRHQFKIVNPLLQ